MGLRRRGFESTRVQHQRIKDQKDQTRSRYKGMINCTESWPFALCHRDISARSVDYILVKDRGFCGRRPLQGKAEGPTQSLAFLSDLAELAVEASPARSFLPPAAAGRNPTRGRLNEHLLAASLRGAPRPCKGGYPSPRPWPRSRSARMHLDYTVTGVQIGRKRDVVHGTVFGAISARRSIALNWLPSV